MTQISRLMPGFAEFVRWSSPATHADRRKLPIFLFQAQDDSNTPYAETAAFHGRLTAHNAAATLSSVPTGDHYQPMISAGIPAAIRWIQGLP